MLCTAVAVVVAVAVVAAVMIVMVMIMLVVAVLDKVEREADGCFKSSGSACRTRVQHTSDDFRQRCSLCRQQTPHLSEGFLTFFSTDSYAGDQLLISGLKDV